MPTKTPKLILICTGLGRVNRGFEQYIASLAAKLVTEPGFAHSLEVWTGGAWQASGIKSRRIPNLARSGWLLGNKTTAFLWEQRSFFWGLLPRLFWLKNAVIYLGEFRLYCYLFKLRRILGLKFKLALYTGGYAIPSKKMFDSSLDFIHHVNIDLYKEATYLPVNRQNLIPHFIDFDFKVEDELKKELLKHAKGRHIVLCVGSIDFHYKRTNLFVEALALCKTEVFPVLLGEPSKDSILIEKTLKSKWGANGYILTSVPRSEMGTYYEVATLLVHVAKKEIFGLIFPEALFHGVPVITFRNDQTEWILKKYGNWLNEDNAGKIAQRVDQFFRDDRIDQFKKQEMQAFAENSFSWNSLANKYVEMFNKM